LNQVTLDPGAHLHVVRCVGASGELHVVGDLALERLADADLDRLRPRGRWVLTAPRQKHHAEKEGRKAHRGTTHCCTSCSSLCHGGTPRIPVFWLSVKWKASFGRLAPCGDEIASGYVVASGSDVARPCREKTISKMGKAYTNRRPKSPL